MSMNLHGTSVELKVRKFAIGNELHMAKQRLAAQQLVLNKSLQLQVKQNCEYN